MSKLTREQIETMEAGRDIDALIAEFVTKITTCPYCGDIPDPDLPHYSTDIAASWQVVEKFDKFFLFNVCKINHREGFDYQAQIYEDFGTFALGSPKFAASAQTASLAICRAALLAVME